jgi:hypothetical protein
MSFKITIQAGEPLSTTVLGDDSAGEMISGWLPGIEAEVQPIDLLRAEWKRFASRGNAATEMAFVTDRAKSDYGEALRFIADHLRTVPRQGLVQVSLTGTQSFSWYLKDAVLRSVKCVRHSGVSFLFQYVIIGGEPLATNPVNIA